MDNEYVCDSEDSDMYDSDQYDYRDDSNCNMSDNEDYLDWLPDKCIKPKNRNEKNYCDCNECCCDSDSD
jgi:hypothetical protein